MVGCSLHHAGTHPLNMKAYPSFAMAVLIAPIVEEDPGPEAFMIRDCQGVCYFDDVERKKLCIPTLMTSAGEHTARE